MHWSPEEIASKKNETRIQALRVAKDLGATCVTIVAYFQEPGTNILHMFDAGYSPTKPSEMYRALMEGALAAEAAAERPEKLQS